MQILEKKISYYFINGKLDIETVMDDYTNYIYKIIKRICINLSEEDIEEIYLDVFFALWQNQSKLDVNKPISSYLCAVTRNIITHKLREFKDNENILDCEEKIASNFNLESTLEWQEEEKIIYNQLRNLKEKSKDIFILYYYKNKSIDEISKLYNLSKSNIKVILFRIRKRMKKALSKEGNDYNE